MTDPITDRLAGVFRMIFGDEITLSDELSAADIPEWDSLANINLLFAVEEEFGIRIPDSDYSAFATVGDLRRYLLRRTSSA